jgi:hypothetical protein
VRKISRRAHVNDSGLAQNFVAALLKKRIYIVRSQLMLGARAPSSAQRAQHAQKSNQSATTFALRAQCGRGARVPSIRARSRGKT